MIIKKNRLNKNTELGDIQEVPSENFSDTAEVFKEPDIEIKTDNAQKFNSSGSDTIAEKLPDTPMAIKDDNEIDIFDVDNIDFSQRQERRRGDRRRGYRRVDDRNLVSRAREEADSIRESALKEGYDAGLNQALSDVEEFKNSFGQFLNSKQDVFDYIAPSILDISIDIAKKIIKKEIEQDSRVLINTIVDVLKTLPKEESKVTLRVNPSEVNTVKQTVPELLNVAGLDAKIVVLSDEEIAEGGCLVVTSNGIVDATIDTRIEVICKALKEL